MAGWGYYAGKRAGSSRPAGRSWPSAPDRERSTCCGTGRRPGGCCSNGPAERRTSRSTASLCLALRALRIQHEAGTAALISALEHAKEWPSSPSPTHAAGQHASGMVVDSRHLQLGRADRRGACSPSRSGPRAEGFDPDRSADQVAERCSMDRCCVKGGWNYGNSNVHGQRIEGLRSDHRHRAAGDAGSGDRTRRRASRRLSGTPSHVGALGLALSLALMCLAAYGRPTDGDSRRAGGAGPDDASRSATTISAALTLCALQPGVGDAAVLLDVA